MREEWRLAVGRHGLQTIMQKPTGMCFSNVNDVVPVSLFFGSTSQFKSWSTPMFMDAPSGDRFNISGRKNPLKSYSHPYKLELLGVLNNWSVIAYTEQLVIGTLNCVMFCNSYHGPARPLAAVVVRDVNYPDLFWLREHYNKQCQTTYNTDIPLISPSLVEFWYDEILQYPQPGLMGKARRFFQTYTMSYFKQTGMRIETKSMEEMSSLIYRPKINFASLEEINEWKAQTMWKVYDSYGHTNLDGFAPDTGNANSIQGVPAMDTNR